MSSLLKKVKPRPRNPKCKCCIAKANRLARREKSERQANNVH